MVASMIANDTRVPIAGFVVTVRRILADSAMGSREIKGRLGVAAGLPGSNAHGQDRVHAALQVLKKCGHVAQQTRGSAWYLTDAGRQWLKENAK